MSRLDWHMDTTVLGLSMIGVNIGIAGMGDNAAGVSADKQARALVETVIVGMLAAKLTRSYWPVALPLAYLAFDHVWSVRRGHAPEIAASENSEDYDDGN